MNLYANEYLLLNIRLKIYIDSMNYIHPTYKIIFVYMGNYLIFKLISTISIGNILLEVVHEEKQVIEIIKLLIYLFKSK